MLVAQDRQRPRRAPKSAHKDAKAALAEVDNAEDRDHAEQAAKALAAAYGAKVDKVFKHALNGFAASFGRSSASRTNWLTFRVLRPP